MNIHHTTNIVPFGTQGEEYAQKWAQEYPTSASRFYSKWTNLKTTYTFDDVWRAHNHLFMRDITVWNDPDELFLDVALVQLYLAGCLTEDEVRELHRRTFQRLGHAVDGHEEVWETLGTNLETLVLGALILEEYPHLIDTYKQMFKNDIYILAIMDGEVVVPEQMGYPNMSMSKQGVETFKFLEDLAEI